MITDTMTALADAIRDALISDGIKRPVVTDPKNVASLPCVLVEPPTILGTGSTMCGYYGTCAVLVLAPPGTTDALRAIAPMVQTILAAVGWTQAQQVAYVPLASPAAADAVLAYRIDVEVSISWQ